MRLLADENCDRRIVNALRSAGHDVRFALEDLQGQSDLELFRLAHLERRIILTDDLDFGHITKSETLRPPAVVIVRISGLSRDERCRRVLDSILALRDVIEGHIAVITPAQIRLRAMERF